MVRYSTDQGQRHPARARKRRRLRRLFPPRRHLHPPQPMVSISSRSPSHHHNARIRQDPTLNLPQGHNPRPNHLPRPGNLQPRPLAATDLPNVPDPPLHLPEHQRLHDLRLRPARMPGRRPRRSRAPRRRGRHGVGVPDQQETRRAHGSGDRASCARLYESADQSAEDVSV